MSLNIPIYTLSGPTTSVPIKYKLSGTVASGNSAIKTISAYKRSTGELMASTNMREDNTWALYVESSEDQDLFVICRDEGGDFNADIYDRVSLCTIDELSPNNFSDIILQNGLVFDSVGCYPSPTIAAFPNEVLRHNLKNDIASFIYDEAYYTGTFKDVSDQVIDVATANILIGNGVLINSETRTSVLTVLDPETVSVGGILGETTSQNPLVSSLDTVTSTSKLNTSYQAHYAVDGTKLLTGGWSANQWLSSTAERLNIKFNVELRDTIVPGIMLINNSHSSGSSTNTGIRNIIVYGTNSNAAFLNTDYANVDDLTEIGAFEVREHRLVNVEDEQYFTLSATVAYAYIVIRIADNWGNASYTGIRHIEFRESVMQLPSLEIGTEVNTITADTLSIDSLSLNGITKKPNIMCSLGGSWGDSLGEVQTYIDGLAMNEDSIQFDGTSALHKLDTCADTSTGGSVGDESNVDIVCKFKLSVIPTSGNHIMYKSGDAVDGVALGFSGTDIGIFGTSTSVVTSLLINSSVIEVENWYTVHYTSTGLYLYDNNGITIDFTEGSVTAGDGEGQESVGGACAGSPLSATQDPEYFEGLISDISVYSGGTSVVGYPSTLRLACEVGDTGQQCYVEVEKWDIENLEAELWVNIPTISATEDTELRFYFHEDHAPNIAYVGNIGDLAAQNVWDSNYIAVYHMVNESGTIKDSTANALHLTLTGGSTVSGLIGDAVLFDGISDVATVIDAAFEITDTGLSYEAVINRTEQLGTLGTIATKGQAGSNLGAFFGVPATSDEIQFGTATDYISGGTIAIDAVTSIAAVYDGTDNATGLALYSSGIALATSETGTFAGFSGSAEPFSIGAQSDDGVQGSFLSAAIDELRISSIGRTPEHIALSDKSNSDTLFTYVAGQALEVVPGFTFTIPATPLADSTTSLLIHSDTTEGDVVFDDSAIADNQIAVFGSISHEIDQVKFGQTSIYTSNGAANYLSVPHSDGFDFGADDFTIDFWIRPNALGVASWPFGWLHNGSNNSGSWLRIESNNTLHWNIAYDNGYYVDALYTDPITLDWNHIALVRESTLLKMYLNGVFQSSWEIGSSVMTPEPTNGLSIGRPGNWGSSYFNGHFDEIRISKGLARWTADFTPPTEQYSIANGSPLTSTLTNFPTLLNIGTASGIDGTDTSEIISEAGDLITDTSTTLLLHSDSTNGSVEFIDSSTSAHSLTITGTLVHDTAQSVFGSTSIYTNGTGYMYSTSSQEFAFGLDDFTIDFWYNPHTLVGNQYLMDIGANGCVFQMTTGKLKFYNPSLGAGSTLYVDGPTLVVGTWYHIAVVRFNGITSAYVNGVSYASASDARDYPEAIFNLGRYGGGAYYTQGYFDEFRISKGLARWTADFTPPTAPHEVFTYPRLSASVDGIPCYLELEKWDTATSSAKVWCKVPNIAVSEDTEITVLYGENAASTYVDYVGVPGSVNARNVWDDNFVGVYHMAQDPLAGIAIDSSASGNHGSISGDPQVVDSLIGDGYLLDGAGDYITLPSAVTLDYTSMTVEATASATDLSGVLIGSSTSGSYIFHLSSNLVYHKQGNGQSYAGDINLLNGELQQWVSRSDSTIPDFFIDGIKSTGTGTIQGVPIDIDYIGRYQTLGTNDWDGDVDEVRFSNIPRSDDWLKLTSLSNTDTLTVVSARNDAVVPVVPLPTTVFAQTVIFDVADSHGAAGMAVRGIRFFKGGVELPIGTAFTAYATDSYGTYIPDNIFDSSMRQTGAADPDVAWYSLSTSPIRIIIVFNELQEFDEIWCNNNHHSGTQTDYGINNVATIISTDVVTSIVYGEEVPNSTLLDDSPWPEHTAVDEEDWKPVYTYVQDGYFKTMLFDIADNHGDPTNLGVRQISFYYEGGLLPLTGADYTAYSTSTFSGYPATAAFDTSLSITGAGAGNGWIAGTSTNSLQRLIVVFNILQQLDEIRIVNSHGTGTNTDVGANNVKITGSVQEVTDTTYDAGVVNSEVLAEGSWPEHIAEDVEDWSTVYEIIVEGFVKSVIFDCEDNWGDGSFAGIRSVEFYLEGVKYEFTTEDFTAQATTEYSFNYSAEKAFDTTTSKIGTQDLTTWMTLTNEVDDQRLGVVFNTPIKFDKIVINNYHASGGSTTRGMKNVRITTSTDTITSTVYNEAIPNSTVLNDTIWPAHDSVNEADDQIVYELSEDLFDIIVGDDTGALANFSRRAVIETSIQKATGDRIRIRFMHDGTDWDIDSCYIGICSNGISSFDGNQTQVTFDGGAAGKTITSGDVYSDEIDFTIDGTTEILVAFYSSTLSCRWLNDITGLGIRTYSKGSVGDTSADTNPTMTTYTNQWGGVETIEFPPAAEESVYQVFTFEGTELDEDNWNVTINESGTVTQNNQLELNLTTGTGHNGIWYDYVTEAFEFYQQFTVEFDIIPGAIDYASTPGSLFVLSKVGTPRDTYYGSPYTSLNFSLRSGYPLSGIRASINGSGDALNPTNIPLSIGQKYHIRIEATDTNFFSMYIDDATTPHVTYQLTDANALEIGTWNFTFACGSYNGNDTTVYDNFTTTLIPKPQEFVLADVPTSQKVLISIPAQPSMLVDFPVLINLSSNSGLTGFDCSDIFTKLSAKEKQSVTTWYSNNSFGDPSNMEDGNLASYAQSFTYLCGDFTDAFALGRFRMAVHNLTAYTDIEGHTLQGSNDTTDGTDGIWDTLLTFTAGVNINEPATYPGWVCDVDIASTVEYRFYRLTGSGSTNNVKNEWELYTAGLTKKIALAVSGTETQCPIEIESWEVGDQETVAEEVTLNLSGSSANGQDNWRFALPSDSIISSNGTVAVVFNTKLISYTINECWIGIGDLSGNFTGSKAQVTFAGNTSHTIAIDADNYVSDAVPLVVASGDNLVISINVNTGPAPYNTAGSIFDLFYKNVGASEAEQNIISGYAPYTNGIFVQGVVQTNTKMEAILWAKIPLLSSSKDTVLALYYDETQADNTTYVGNTGEEVAQSVWDDNFEAVYHMSQDPSAGGACILDSTSNSRNLTPNTAMSSNSLVSSSIGNGIQFVKANSEYLLITGQDFSSLQSSYTLEANQKWTAPNTYYDRIIRLGNPTNGALIMLGSVSTQFYDIGVWADNVRSVIPINTEYADTVMTFDASDGLLRLAQDGVWDATTNAVTIKDLSNDALLIGGDPGAGGTSYADQIISEIRISSVKRTDDWLIVTNLSNSDTLVTFSVPALGYIQHYPPLATWEIHDGFTATISADDVPTQQTNFPARVKVSSNSGLSGTDLTHVLSSMKKDFTFTGTVIAESEFGVARDQLSHFNNANVKFSANHLLEPDKSMSFDGTGTDVITVEDTFRNTLVSGELTVAFWMKCDIGCSGQRLAIFGTEYPHEISIEVDFTAAYRRLYVTCGYSTYYHNPVYTLNILNIDKWVHVTYKRNKTDNIVAIYINGELVATAGMTRAVTAGTAPILIGDNASRNPFVGELSDLCIWDTTLTDDDIRYAYQNSELYTYVNHYAVSIFASTNVEFPLLLGSTLTQVRTEYSDVGLKVYACTPDRDTYWAYIDDNWKAIASMDPAVHGDTGNATWFYLDSLGVWNTCYDNANNALALAFEHTSNCAPLLSLGTLSPAVLSDLFNTATGIFDVAIGIRTDTQFELPYVTKVTLNDTNFWASDVYDLNPHSGSIVTSNVEWSYSELRASGYFKVYVIKTGDTEWTECTSNSDSIPGITPGMDTTGMHMQFKVEYNLLLDTDPEEIRLVFNIT